jgi:hypothetical protein
LVVCPCAVATRSSAKPIDIAIQLRTFGSSIGEIVSLVQPQHQGPQSQDIELVRNSQEREAIFNHRPYLAPRRLLRCGISIRPMSALGHYVQDN